MLSRLVLAGVIAGLTFGASASAQVVVTSGGQGSITTIQQGPPTEESPTSGTAAISGVVTDSRTGLPVDGAVVALSGGGRPGGEARPQEMTDSRGRFLFTNLPAFANYVVSATKFGYLPGGYKRVPGIAVVPRIALQDGQWFQTADVPLSPVASISGMVLDDQGDPVVGVPVRALVSVQVAGRARLAAGPTTETDDRGMYRLGGLSAGQYLVHVPSVQVTLPDDAIAPQRPVVSVSAGGGLVTNQETDPDAFVRAGDGLGLLVGYYATPPADGRAVAYAMAYYPASRSVEGATVITLDYGDQHQGVDVQLTLLPTVRVSGRVLGPAEAAATLPVRLMPGGTESLGLGAEAALTTTDAQGAFTFLRVPSGAYTLIASRSVSEFAIGSSSTRTQMLPRSAMTITSMSSGQVPGSNGVSYSSRSGPGAAAYGRVPVIVDDRDLEDVVVPLVGGVTVSGHFLWDGAEAMPDGVAIGPLVRLEPADGDLSIGLRSGRPPRRTNEPSPVPVPFEIDGVLPGRYVFGMVASGSYAADAIEWRGRNMMTTPLEIDGTSGIDDIVIRMSSKTISLTGSVLDGLGAPASSGAVLSFPASSALWRNFGLSAALFRNGTIVGDGTYRIDRLVPGEYLLAAVPDADRAKWVDPEFLASIAGAATRVQVGPGATVTQNLRMIGGRR